MEQLPNGLILVRGAGAGGVNPNFFYLTGIAEPRAVLLLAPAGTRVVRGRAAPGPDYVRGQLYQQVLFLPPGDPLAARWGEDSAATLQSVSAEAAGVEAVFSIAEMPALLSRALGASARLYYVRAQEIALGGDEGPDAPFVAELRRRFFHLQIADGTPAVQEMRRLKDAEEIRGIERSVAVVGEALERALQLVRSGAREYEIEAEITRTYRANGGIHAFEPIVASGANACVLHYTENSGTLGAGELLLIDTGVSIDGYKADITRTYPVDGRFTTRQRELYEAVLAAHAEVVQGCRPGALLGDLHADAWQVLDARGQSAAFVHGIGHHLGLETHDVGDVHRPLAPGAVVTVEPGVYLPDEKTGIRIEDDVLVTPDGPRVLSEAIPRSADAVERQLAARRSA